MSKHRLALAGILAALVAVFALTGAGATADPQAQAYDPIVQRALQDEGTYQGDCWPWVRKVVYEATGREMGFDYRQGFFDAGAVEVSLTDARSGDVIQLADDADTAPDADYEGLHTAIVMDNLGGGLVRVIDSNSQWDGIVRIRDNYDPQASADRYSTISYHVYRFSGSKTPPPAAAPKAATPLAAGDKAIVRADGDGLNLRDAAGINGAVLTILPDGTEVVVTSTAPVRANGRDWVSVSSTLGSGWVAVQYLVKEQGTPAASNGRSLPLMPFRAFVPLISYGGE